MTVTATAREEIASSV